MVAPVPRRDLAERLMADIAEMNALMAEQHALVQVFCIKYGELRQRYVEFLETRATNEKDF